MKKLSFIILLFLGVGMSAGAQQASATTIDPAEKMMKLYPNPATSYITFESKSTIRKALTLQIYNGILGKKMIDTPISLDKLTLSLNEFSRGIYVYYLVDPAGKIIESGKFQVTK